MWHTFFSKIISLIFSSKKNDFSSIFDHIYVINLKRCLDRKKHTIQEFSRIGINDYEFIEAIDKDDPQVSELLESGRVSQFPPCFRCEKNRCDCINNILTPQHIGNWCSFIKVWQDMLDKNYNFCLICEDDLKFTYHFNECITRLFKQEAYANHQIDINKPLLIRLSKAFETQTHSKKLWEKHRFTKNKTMSNPCFAINKAMAKILLENIQKINHTSDVYIHKLIIEKYPEIQHFTAWPIPVYELSFQGKMKFYSEIRPKGIDAQDKIRQKNTIMRKEYKEILCLSHPRCGSGYASFLLKHLGLNIDHENMGEHGISSWMLVANDCNYPWGDVGVDKKSGSIDRYYFANTIHVLRNPFMAIPAIMLENQHSRNNDSYTFRSKHIKQILGTNFPASETTTNHIDLAAKTYLAWNKIISNRQPDFVFRIEYDQNALVKFLIERQLIQDKPHNFSEVSQIKINEQKLYAGIKYEKQKLSKEDILSNVCPETRIELLEFCSQQGYV